MANKERGKNDQQIIDIDPGDEYRTRFMYCSIGATLMCVGVIVLVSGLVVYILSSTGPHTYVNNMFFHNLHDYNNNYWPIIVAIILSSSGIAFITIAIVFTLFACFSHGRIEDHFRNQQQISPQPIHRNNINNHHHHQQQQQQNSFVNDRSQGIVRNTRTPLKATHDLYEEERLISSPTTSINVNPSTQYQINHQTPIYRSAPDNQQQQQSNVRHVTNHLNNSNQQHQEQPSQSNTMHGSCSDFVHHPIQTNQQHQHQQHQQQQQQQPPVQIKYVPVVPSKTVEKQSATFTELSETNSPSTSSSSSSNSIHQSTPKQQKGDINTVGLPLVNHGITKSSNHHHPKKVPPNGFSYLTHPEEIHIFHEYHHQRTSSSGDNHHHHHQQSNNRNNYHMPQPPPPPPPPPATRSTIRTTNHTASTSHESVL
mgnify:CR=1 FL=1